MGGLYITWHDVECPSLHVDELEEGDTDSPTSEEQRESPTMSTTAVDKPMPPPRKKTSSKYLCNAHVVHSIVVNAGGVRDIVCSTGKRVKGPYIVLQLGGHCSTGKGFRWPNIVLVLVM